MDLTTTTTTNQSNPPQSQRSILLDPQFLMHLERIVRTSVREELHTMFMFPHCNLPPRQAFITDSSSPPILYPRTRLIPTEAINPSFQLKFLDQVDQPVYTTFQVQRQNSQPLGTGLRIAIYRNNDKITHGPLASAKIEVLPLRADFCKNVWDNWSQQEFQNAVLINRNNKPPVLLVNHAIQLKNGEATIDWLVYGDNSSWTRANMFRLGIRLLNWEGERVKEGITDPFTVKDRRMEASKKHHPPLSSDEIWRLEGIAKNGDRCKSLNQKDIYTVKDLIESYSKDEAKLREILGGISETSRAWKKIIGHAKECADLVDSNGVLNQSNQLPKVLVHTIGRTIPFQTNGGPLIVGSGSSVPNPCENSLINPATSILNLAPTQHTSAGVLQVEISSNSEPMGDLSEHGELTCNTIQVPLQGSSFYIGSCDPLVQGFKASMSHSQYVGPLLPCRKTKIKVLFKLITFLAGPRKRARIMQSSRYQTLENTSQPQQDLGCPLGRNIPLCPNGRSHVISMVSHDSNTYDNNSNDQGNMSAYYRQLSPICDIPPISNEQISTTCGEHPVEARCTISADRNHAVVEEGNTLNVDVHGDGDGDGLSELQLSDYLTPMGDDLSADAESTPNYDLQVPWISDDSDAGFPVYFTRTMSTSVYVGPMSPRKKAKMKALLRSIVFFAVPRKRASVAPPANQTRVPAF